jgi:hypothetical protein
MDKMSCDMLLQRFRQKSQNTSQPTQNKTMHRLQKQHKTTMTLLPFRHDYTQQPTFKITLKRKLSHAIKKPTQSEIWTLWWPGSKFLSSAGEVTEQASTHASDVINAPSVDQS